jgi:porin
MVWRIDEDSERGLTLYGGALISVAGIGEARDYILAATIFNGPFDKRPDDILALGITIFQFNPRFTGAVNDQITATGKSGTVSSTEATLELNYGIAVAPGVTFKPFVQYIANPDQIGATAPSSHVTHAWTAGGQLSINFNGVLGLKALARAN